MRYLVLLVLVNQIQDISNLQFPGRTRREEPTTELNISDSVGLDPGGGNIEPEPKSSKLDSGFETVEALPTPSKLVSGFEGIEALPTPSKLLSDFGNHFDSSGSFSQDSYVEQELPKGGNRFDGKSQANDAANRAQAAEQAQHSAAAKAALEAALKLAEEAKTAAKEAESVAAAKQYHAAHLSSAAQSAQGRAFSEASFLAKVSKVLQAAEGQEKQAAQHAETLKAAAYAAQALAEQAGYVTIAMKQLSIVQKRTAQESREAAKMLSAKQQEALDELTHAQASSNKAHAAASAAMANVHKDGIYGGAENLESVSYDDFMKKKKVSTFGDSYSSSGLTYSSSLQSSGEKYLDKGESESSQYFSDPTSLELNKKFEFQNSYGLPGSEPGFNSEIKPETPSFTGSQGFENTVYTEPDKIAPGLSNSFQDFGGSRYSETPGIIESTNVDQGSLSKFSSSQPYVSLGGSRRFSDSLNPDPSSGSQDGETIHVGPEEFASITGGKFTSNDDFGLKPSSFSGSDLSGVGLKNGISMESSLGSNFMSRLEGGFRYSSIPEPSFSSSLPSDGDGYRVVNEFSSGDDSKLYTPSSFRNIENADGNSTLLETEVEASISVKENSTKSRKTSIKSALKTLKTTKLPRFRDTLFAKRPRPFFFRQRLQDENKSPTVDSETGDKDESTSRVLEEPKNT